MIPILTCNETPQGSQDHGYPVDSHFPQIIREVYYLKRTSHHPCVQILHQILRLRKAQYFAPRQRLPVSADAAARGDIYRLFEFRSSSRSGSSSSRVSERVVPRVFEAGLPNFLGDSCKQRKHPQRGFPRKPVHGPQRGERRGDVRGEEPRV